MKKVLLCVTAIVAVVALAITGTIAYLQSDDSAVNVMTLGNVKIEQIEQERDANGNLVDFTQAKAAYPAVGPVAWAAQGVEVNGTEYKVFTPELKNVVDKIVTVKNIGKSEAYVRTILAIETPDYDPNNWVHLNINEDGVSWGNWILVEIDGVEYCAIVATYDAALAPGGISAPSLLQVFLDSAVDNEYCAAFGDTWEIHVLSQAVQVNGFDDATTALDTGFGEVTEAKVREWFGATEVPVVADNEQALKEAINAGKNVYLTKSLSEVAIDTRAPYGNWTGLIQNGGVLEGTGKVLDFEVGPLVNGKSDNYGIMTSGGTIKNITITGVFRGIMVMNPTEDVILDNVVIGDEDLCYAINTGEGNGQHSMYVSNSTIKGWSSYGTAIKDLYFTNCTFAQGEYYTNVYGRLVKPYVDTVFDSCEFSNKFYIDLSQLGKDGSNNVINPDAKIVLRNCTVNGVKLTASNWKDLIASEDDCMNGQITIEGKDGSYMTASNIFNYVIFE